MDFKIKGENKELLFGVRFVAEVDATEEFESEGISFGMGLMMVQEKLKMGNLQALVTILQKALYKHNLTEDEVFDAVDEYIETHDLETLIEKVETELKNSNAVRTAKARMEKQSQEAARKKAAQTAMNE